MSIGIVIAVVGAIILFKLMFDVLLVDPVLEDGSVTGRTTTKVSRYHVAEDPNSLNPQYMVGGMQEGQSLGSDVDSGMHRRPAKEVQSPPPGIYYIQHVESLRSLNGGNMVSLVSGFPDSAKWDVREDGCIKNVGLGQSLLWTNDEEKMVKPLGGGMLKACIDCKVKLADIEWVPEWKMARVEGEMDPGIFSLSYYDYGFLGAGRVNGVKLGKEVDKWLFIPVGSRGYVQY
jgi:hypothetical protein